MTLSLSKAFKKPREIKHVRKRKPASAEQTNPKKTNFCLPALRPLGLPGTVDPALTLLKAQAQKHVGKESLQPARMSHDQVNKLAAGGAKVSESQR